LDKILASFFWFWVPVFAMGVEIFCHKALKNGADGVLIVDLPFEESDEILRFKETEKLCLIRLIAPLTPYKRMKMIAKSASGFIYLISKTGITGSIGFDAKKTSLIAKNLRSATSLPICTGFGISTSDHVKAVAAFSDGVVIGSAFVKIIEDNLENRINYWEKLLALKSILLDDYLPEAIFKEAYFLENGKEISRVYMPLNSNVSIHNKNTWRETMEFFNKNMNLFEAFFEEYKEVIMS